MEFKLNRNIYPIDYEEDDDIIYDEIPKEDDYEVNLEGDMYEEDKDEETEESTETKENEEVQIEDKTIEVEKNEEKEVREVDNKLEGREEVQDTEETNGIIKNGYIDEHNGNNPLQIFDELLKIYKKNKGK